MKKIISFCLAITSSFVMSQTAYGQHNYPQNRFDNICRWHNRPQEKCQIEVLVDRNGKQVFIIQTQNGELIAFTVTNYQRNGILQVIASYNSNGHRVFSTREIGLTRQNDFACLQFTQGQNTFCVDLFK